MTNSPEFVTSQRRIGDGGNRSRTDQGRSSFVFDHRRRAVCFFAVAVVGAVIDGAFFSPGGFSCFLIQRDNILLIDAVKVQEEHVAKEDG